jgi:hypothetical protein
MNELTKIMLGKGMAHTFDPLGDRRRAKLAKKAGLR